MGDTIIDYSSASQMQQDFLTARNEIAKKAQTHIKSLSGMSSKEAMDEILAALEGESTVLNDEDKKTLDVLFGVGETWAHEHFATTRKEAAKALKELQSMTQKNISYAEKNQEP